MGCDNLVSNAGPLATQHKHTLKRTPVDEKPHASLAGSVFLFNEDVFIKIKGKYWL